MDWPKGSEIVVTTTDYVPEHSEVATLSADADGTNVITLDKRLEQPALGDAVQYWNRVGTAHTAFRTAVAAADDLKASDTVPFLHEGRNTCGGCPADAQHQDRL